MRYQKLGNSDLEVSELCLGTMTYGEQNTPEDARAQLDYAVAQGINFIDTAEMYPVPGRPETQGRTEDYVGRWLRDQRRHQLIVASKVTGAGRPFDWIRGGPRVVRHQIEQAVHGSLRRLQTDYLDLYQIHWPDRNVPLFGQAMFDPERERETVPIEEQLRVFQDLVQAGKIRYLGISNETPWGACSFVRAAEALGLPRVVSIQNAYNLINRSFEYGLSEVAFRERISLLAYSPLGFGVLTGKYLERQSGRITQFPGFGQRYDKANVPEAVTAYVGLARALGITPVALAIGFVRSRWFVTSTIIGATTLAQLRQDIEDGQSALSAEAISGINEIHQRFPNPAP